MIQYERPWKPRPLFIERHDGAVWTGTSWSDIQETRALYQTEEDLPVKLPADNDEDAWWFLKLPRNDVYVAHGLGPCAYVFEEND